MDADKKVVGGWWIWILTLSILTIVILGGMKYLGVIGATVVERVVFEQSFQYKEGMKQRGAILEAQLAEIDMLIATGQGDVESLRAQRSVINVQLRAMKQ